MKRIKNKGSFTKFMNFLSNFKLCTMLYLEHILKMKQHKFNVIILP